MCPEALETGIETCTHPLVELWRRLGDIWWILIKSYGLSLQLDMEAHIPDITPCFGLDNLPTYVGEATKCLQQQVLSIQQARLLASKTFTRSRQHFNDDIADKTVFWQKIATITLTRGRVLACLQVLPSPLPPSSTLSGGGAARRRGQLKNYPQLARKDFFCWRCTQ